MFDKIDNFWINWFQYTVRQFELYTPIKRKGLINFFLFLVGTVIIAELILSLTLLVHEEKIGMAMFFAAACMAFLYLGVKITSVDQKATDLLPKEIISRKIQRLLSIFFVISVISLTVYFLFLVSIALNEIINQMLMHNIVSFLICMILFICFGFFMICLEYLFCTVSLPPGEKQKRKEEKETRNMTPVSN